MKILPNCSAHSKEFKALRGRKKSDMITDEWMRLLRGDEKTELPEECIEEGQMLAGD